MKLTNILIMLGYVTAMAVAAEVGAPTLTVAVFDFDSKDESVKGLGPNVATLVSAGLSAHSQIITVERAELDKLLSEQELGLSGSVDKQTAAKVGQLTGAKVLVTGRVFKADKNLVIVAKIISTETSRVYGEIVQGVDSEALTDLAGQLADKIAKTITEKAETLVAKVPSRQERIEKLKKTCARQSVAINRAQNSGAAFWPTGG